MINDYRFGKYERNGMGFYETNIKISEDAFENYYNFFLKLTPLERLSEEFQFVKNQYNDLLQIPYQLHKNKIPFGKVFNRIEESATLYTITHVLFLHSSNAFIKMFLSKVTDSKKFKNPYYIDSLHQQNIRAVRNYAEHFWLPITKLNYNLEIKTNSKTVSFPIKIDKKKMIFYDQLHKSSKRIIDKWNHGKIRLDIEITAAWDELNTYYKKIFENYLKKQINSKILNQLKQDKDLWKQKLLLDQVIGVGNMINVDNGWQYITLDDPEFLKKAVEYLLNLTD